jgi:hypothetical protein
MSTLRRGTPWVVTHNRTYVKPVGRHSSAVLGFRYPNNSYTEAPPMVHSVGVFPFALIKSVVKLTQSVGAPCGFRNFYEKIFSGIS